MTLDEEEDKEVDEEKRDVTRRKDRFFWKKVCPLDSNLSPLLLLPSFLIILLVEQALFSYLIKLVKNLAECQKN